MAKQSSVRLAAARVVTRVVNGDSLNKTLTKQQETIGNKDQALLAELCYGTVRHYVKLDAWLQFLMDKPLKAKEKNLHSLILVGLYQLFHTRIPHHAAIGETVQATRTLGKAWARGLVNGVLRSAQRRCDQLQLLTESNQRCATAHPDWLVDTIKTSWPEHWQQIIAENNHLPPMTLRVNSQRISRDRYLKKLLDACIQAKQSQTAPQGITLNKAIPVTQLPMFSEGVLSVQDESAQLAGMLVNPSPGERILDACCAPGGKTCHMLEQHEGIEVHALDCSETRLLRVKENLERLNLSATVICGDARQPEQWWDGKTYDHILLDAPCSATGVIRRHPDIKLLRTPEDIEALAILQKQILTRLWSLLKRGGTLLYVTCSIMPQENQRQIERFLATHNDALLQPLPENWGYDTGFGRQIFPGSGDGFFYSLLSKSAYL
ncbi:16S rRNA (cytosine(967)-C(5))-methyltransferase RsmB [Candidatus Sororendozoicomonas aggregata]|uniref:16S rRNA (cytosine(967)-C(5))-methyltransferase RsmB n=1 Tax=Candidatus Sororendozoicomonas aggregata TaxID=3073239 RepID=UPI002ED1389C